MDQTCESTSRPRLQPFRTVLQPVSVGLAILGLPALCQAADAVDSPPLLASQTVSAGQDFTNAVPAHKRDTPSLNHDLILAEENTLRPAAERAPALEPGVESLLARMAQAVPVAPSDTRGEPGASTAPSANGSSVESLLARMAEAVSSGPSPSSEKLVAASGSPGRSESRTSSLTVDQLPSPKFQGGENFMVCSDGLTPDELTDNAPLPGPDLVKPAPGQAAKQTVAAGPLLRTNAPSANALTPTPARVPRVVASVKPVKSVPVAPLPLRTNTRVALNTASGRGAPKQTPPPAPTPGKTAPAAPPKPAPHENSSVVAQSSAKAAPTLETNLVARAASEPRPRPFVNPAVLSKLRLRAVAAFGKRRSANINGRTIFQGEEAEFNFDGANLKVHCLEVKPSSAVLEIAGITGTTELRMPDIGK